jgi:hypothetical protein
MEKQQQEQQKQQQNQLSDLDIRKATYVLLGNEKWAHDYAQRTVEHLPPWLWVESIAWVIESLSALRDKELSVNKLVNENTNENTNSNILINNEVVNIDENCYNWIKRINDIESYWQYFVTFVQKYVYKTTPVVNLPKCALKHAYCVYILTEWWILVRFGFSVLSDTLVIEEEEVQQQDDENQNEEEINEEEIQIAQMAKLIKKSVEPGGYLFLIRKIFIGLYEYLNAVKSHDHYCDTNLTATMAQRKSKKGKSEQKTVKILDIDALQGWRELASQKQNDKDLFEWAQQHADQYVLYQNVPPVKIPDSWKL